MLTRTVVTLLVLASLTAVGCAPEYSRRSGYGRHAHSGDEAWDIVRHDPCRYDEYRRFADKHGNPERRRAFVEQLAREGCSRDRNPYDDRGY